MNIQNNPNINFKGYDARRLKGFFMSSNAGDIVNKMQYIGRKEGFDVFSKINRGTEVICDISISEAISKENKSIWAQDIWSFSKNKLLTSEPPIKAKPISDYFGIERIESNKHIPGGNVFITNNNGIDELFIGENEISKIKISELKTKYNVDKIHILPQMDYHLDLFIRPLDDKKILLADDNLTLEILEKGKKQFIKFITQQNKKDNEYAKTILFRFEHLIDSFKKEKKKNPLPQTDKIAKIISQAGYEPIKVPGRIYQTYLLGGKSNREVLLSHDCNYMNANVLKNKKEEIVYITNKSNIDNQLMLNNDVAKGFDFRFEKEFIKSIEKYVKPDKIYFIDGNNNYISQTMLKGMQGGIHCACSEIPL